MSMKHFWNVTACVDEVVIAMIKQDRLTQKVGMKLNLM